MTDTTLVADGSSYTVVGNTATCRRVGVALSSSFSVSGSIANLVYSQNVPDKEMPVSGASYSISGQSVAFARLYTLPASAASCNVTDAAPNLVRSYVVKPGISSIGLDGTSAYFIHVIAEQLLTTQYQEPTTLGVTFPPFPTSFN